MSRKLARLFIAADLFPHQHLHLQGKEAHYVAHVLRLKPGDSLLVFNGREGEWRAEIVKDTKKHLLLDVREKTRSQESEPSLALFFAPLKPGSLSFLLEKATELGVTDFHPVWTQRTQGRDFKSERFLTLIREAAEQSERLSFPHLHMPLFLDELLTQWDQKKTLLVCDERPGTQNVLEVLQKEKETMTNSILMGPEGGFSPEEFARMKQHPGFIFLSLGRHILRAETAALSVLSVFHAYFSLSRPRK